MMARKPIEKLAKSNETNETKKPIVTGQEVRKKTKVVESVQVNLDAKKKMPQVVTSKIGDRPVTPDAVAIKQFHTIPSRPQTKLETLKSPLR